MKQRPDRALAEVRVWNLLTRRRPEGLPPAFWDRIGGASWTSPLMWLACIVSVGAFLLLAVCLVIVFSGRNEPKYGAVTACGLDFVAYLIFVWVMRRIKRRFAAELGEADCLICLECGYSLAGSDESERCPECGTAIDRQAIRATWRTMFPSLIRFTTDQEAA